MENIQVEIERIQAVVTEAAQRDLRELQDLAPTVTAGGLGEVCFA
jgi:hypothetical protein